MNPGLLRPRRLRPGDRVVVVSPASSVPPDALAAGVEVLRGWDLDVVVAPHAGGRHPSLPYLAADDADRARDVQDAWCDPSVRGVVCARGGYGVQRMLDLLDWDAMSAATATHGAPVLCGYSDVTALHEAVATRLGVAALHGPLIGFASFVATHEARTHLHDTLFAPERTRVLTARSGETLVGGTARGVTLGGNLSLLAAEVGSGTARPDARGGLVLLEEVEEPHYRLDRMLTQLLRSGWLDGVAGFVLGSWTGCGPQTRDVLLDRLAPLGVPVLDGFGFGHVADGLTMPLGVPATLDADAGTLTLDEPALR